MQKRERSNLGTNGTAALFRSRRALAFCMLFAVLVLVFAVTWNPVCAFADSDPDSGEYSIENVSISADIQTDGSLHVVERRIIRFEEPRASLCWWEYLPGSEPVELQGGISVAQMSSVDQQEVELVPLEYLEYDPDWREGKSPNGQVYSYDEEHERTYAFFDVVGEYVLVQSEYTVRDAMLLYKDCAELRWRFVASGQWSSASQNVSCTVSFPVPAEVAPVAGEDVYAWSHGPEGGGLSFDSGVNSVTVWEETVPSDEYTEVRIMLPVEWISNAPAELKAKNGSSMHRDTVLEEELEWIDQNAYRRLSELSAFIVFAVLSIALIAFSLVLYVLFGRVHKVEPVEGELPPGADDGFSLPMLSRVWNFNRKAPKDLAACVLDLIRKGAVEAEAVEVPCPEGDSEDPESVSTQRVWRLSETGRFSRTELDPVEAFTMHALFDVVGAESGSVWVDDIALGGAVAPEIATDALDSCHLALDSLVRERELFESRGLFWQRAVVIVAVAYLVIAVVVSIALGSFWPALLALACCIAVVAIANQMGRRSRLGSQVYSQCLRLRGDLAQANGEDGGCGAFCDLGAGEWDLVLGSSYVAGCLEDALGALERCGFNTPAAGFSAGSSKSPAAGPHVGLFTAEEGELPLCEQLECAFAQLYDDASWCHQKQRRKESRPCLKERIKGRFGRKKR